ncbi:MAG: O-antigen ligase family protein [Bacillota bacterium]|nr:O-antigen ligase family protein [Bacillota bacterium]
MKRKYLHFSWTTLFIFIIVLASVVRCYNQLFFFSSNTEVLILSFCLGALILKKADQLFKNKISLPITLLVLLCFGIALFRFSPAYYSRSLYAMSIIALGCYFIGLLYGGKFYHVLWLVVGHGALNAIVTWIQIFNYSYYEEYLQRFINPELIGSINRIYKSFGGLCGMSDHYSRNAFFIVSAIFVLFAFFLSEKAKWKKNLYLCATAFFFLTLMTIGKRAHLIFASFILFVVYLCSQKNIKKSIKKGMWATLFILVAGTAVLILVPSSRQTILRIINSLNDGGTDFSTGRINHIYPLAWRLFLNSPWIGNGFGYFTTYTNNAYAGVHNDYLQWLCDYGIVGFVSYMAFTMASFYTIYRIYRTMCKNPMYYSVKVKVLAAWSLLFQGWVLVYSLSGIPHYDYEISILYYIACGIGVCLAIQNRKWRRGMYEENRNRDVV